jgi:rubredoxin
MQLEITYWLCPRCSTKNTRTEEEAAHIEGEVLASPQRPGEVGTCHCCGFAFQPEHPEHCRKTSISFRI